jgi:hypothetical protein
MKPDRAMRLSPSTLPSRQGGAVLVLIAVAMLAILALAGLALDSSHMLLNKARLQNSVDAAALAAAKALDQTGNVAVATTAANSLLDLNGAAAGNRELGQAVGVTRTVEFSSTLQPFVPGSTPAEYVRVTARNFRLPGWLIPLLGINDKVVGASAVAGPSPTILNACNLVPLIACGNPAAGAPYWGYAPDGVHVLKSAAGDGSPIGPGNFQLARLGGNGANVVRQNLAGGYENCSISNIPTQPGVQAGPVQQGINTRFNKYQGGGINSTNYPPDALWKTSHQTNLSVNGTGQITQGGQVVTLASQLNFNYANYAGLMLSGTYDTAPPAAALERRILPTIIADCTGANSGQSTLPVLGVGCFFLLQEVPNGGNQSNIFGQFISDCETGGTPGPNPSSIAGPFRIQLYRNFVSRDS